jgi:hypothetical protein
MTNIDWGEFQGSTGDWQKFRFENPGDSISGEITDLRIAIMADGTRLPSLTIKDDQGGEWSLLASQVGLQRALATARPATGDKISILHTGVGEAKPGKSAPKLFEVALKRADEAPVPTAAPAAPAAAVSAADLL